VGKVIKGEAQLGPQKRRRGDRKDGWLVKSLDPFYKIVPFIMTTRNDASNLFTDTLDLELAEKYIRAKREEGYAGFGMMHVFVAAYVRTVSQRPWINRFVAGQRIYARKNIEVCLAIKRELSTDADESTVKMTFDHRDTAIDVYKKITEEVNRFKQSGGDEANSALRVANAIMKMPRFLIRGFIGFVKWLDYHGKVPASLLAVSPFHGSMFISNLGSLGIPPVYHHLYNFGNVPVFVTFGARRKEIELLKDGTVVERKVMDYTVTSDERICDGYYFARAFKMFKLYMKNPEMLDSPPETVVEDLY
jgi:hypothetical protein